MNQQAIFDLIVTHTRAVVPALAQRPLQRADSLFNLGANSIDRSEIIMLSLESLELDMPLIELARADNLGELTDLMARKMGHA